jgi:hypothetical protein
LRFSTLRTRSLYPALFCVAAFLVCILLVDPRVESGIVDDWSIIRTAQLLAQTGHVHYNGWEAPILGWPLYVAALFIKIFGFSFTVVRSANILVALATVLLAQRIFVRVGISSWNAAFGALTLALCPVFFTTSVLFMTDVPGTLAVLVCLYSCIRATQSPENRQAACWISIAALGNALLGTTRQIAWLGVLVMVPCALWILRRRRQVLFAGAAAWVAGLGILAAVMHWFHRQPYILPEHFFYPGMTARKLVHTALLLAPRVALDLMLLTAPVAWIFLGRIRFRPRVLAWLAVTGVALVAYVVLSRHHIPGGSLAPFLLLPTSLQTAETTFLSYNLPILGPTPSHLTRGVRLAMTAVCFAGVLGLVGTLLSHAGKRAPQTRPGLAGRDLRFLTLPFCLAYFILLLPRATYFFSLDRYLILLLPFTILGLLYRYEAVAGRRTVGVLGWLPLLAMGIYSTGILHDTFAIYRANLAGVNEVEASGLPRTAVNGGLEYNYWTQLLHTDHVYAGGILLPNGTILEAPPPVPYGPCSQVGIQVTPAVHPVYGVAYPSGYCQTVPGFAPIHFNTWFPPFHRTAVIIRYYTPPTTQLFP